MIFPIKVKLYQNGNGDAGKKHSGWPVNNTFLPEDYEKRLILQAFKIITCLKCPHGILFDNSDSQNCSQ